jgi:DNA-binding MarR family transcriptional regulator
MEHLMGKTDDNAFDGFPFLDHILIPSRFILKDMFDLTAWEIRVLMFFFYNLYSTIPCRFIDEAAIIEKFGSATRDLSDTQKATPNIIRVTLASLVKNGYLNVSRKKSTDGKELLFYSIKLDLRSGVINRDSIQGNGRTSPDTKEGGIPSQQQFARIEILEDNDLGAKTPFDIKNEQGAVPPRPVTASHFAPPLILKDTQSPNLTPTGSHSDLNSSDLSDILIKENSKTNTETTPSKTEPPLQIDLNVAQPVKELPIAARNISKEFFSDLEDVINDLNVAKKSSGNEPAVSHSPVSTDSIKQQVTPDELPKEPEKPVADKPAVEYMKAPVVPAEFPKKEISAKTAGFKKYSTPEEQRGAEIWEQVLGQMHVLLDNMTYNTWLKPSEYFKYKDGVHLIKVESVKFYDKFIKQWGNLLQEVIVLIEPGFKYEFYSD